MPLRIWPAVRGRPGRTPTIEVLADGPTAAFGDVPERRERLAVQVELDGANSHVVGLVLDVHFDEYPYGYRWCVTIVPTIIARICPLWASTVVEWF